MGGRFILYQAARKNIVIGSPCKRANGFTNFKTLDDETLRLRIGINTGSVMAGIIGTKKFAYDLWGETVNTAKRMESGSVPGRIQVTAATRERLGDRYLFEDRGVIPVKGVGDMVAYFLIGCKEQP